MGFTSEQPRRYERLLALDVMRRPASPKVAFSTATVDDAGGRGGDGDAPGCCSSSGTALCTRRPARTCRPPRRSSVERAPFAPIVRVRVAASPGAFGSCPRCRR
ncbi:hypothetical protein [Streptomyces sp. KL116D]|uniref:hypothetical protein n=1 Tax=Streptomyces sp. KL116D TaxID=3045152 RepID=UPI003557D9A3